MGFSKRFSVHRFLRLKVSVLLLLCVMLGILACTQSEDGPLAISLENTDFRGEGFFLSANLDSNRTIHLSKDTLYIHMDSIWSYSNCALSAINLGIEINDTVLYVKPQIIVNAASGDCASPTFRPDTVLKVPFDKQMLEGIRQIVAVNTDGKFLDTVNVRHGEMSLDTFSIYIDSIFKSHDDLPLRTKGSPSFFKVLDSITPLKFYWRAMKSDCEMQISKCDSVIYDTLFPSRWYSNDTLLVPVRMACADSDDVFCANAYWKNDSSSLGPVKVHLDTIWNTSTYIVESIPDCGTYDGFTYNLFDVGYKGQFIRNLFTPDDEEVACGPASKKNWMAIDVAKGSILSEQDTLKNIKELYNIWKKAKVAPSKAKK